ncbi:aldehyde dehydrogenase [Rhodococcus sp. Eu-32]|uniref:aldehyde dehydrogenase n=1 Tax=Rhodococcus sp. Eu-32 TaxID=1017319 RepID=UPI000DF2C8EC|nr:aldehyde dehydrogenase [Rhodococcus sp. Eu-32]RRQ29004.1 aldehyde dehydrogenase [Rhodococcus sp. Eu-32]
MTATISSLRSEDRLYIGGQWEKPSNDRQIEVVSPATEKVVATVPEPTPDDIDRAVGRARDAFDNGPWSTLAPSERAAALHRIADEIEARMPEANFTFTEEGGATTHTSSAFNANAVMFWRGAADAIASVQHTSTRDSGDGTNAEISKVPMGVAALITPWNASLANASVKMAPALAAGCTVVVKPAPEAPVANYVLAEAIEAAGLPDGVVSILPAGREVGEHLVSHPEVDKVSFTGSSAAGARVMSLASNDIKRVTLELGGKSPGILTDDVDLDAVLPNLLAAGYGHSGQVCVAITRILVPRSIHDDAVERAAAILRSLTIGDPHSPDTVIGPLIAERQRARVENYFAIGKDDGATLVTGGRRPDHLGRGWYVEPTLFANARPDMRIAREEVFGPVITVLPYDTEDEAVAIANGTEFGLAGCVFAGDIERAKSIARRIDSGQVGVNTAFSNFSLPFGGFKQSGIGREGGGAAIDNFLETRVLLGL